MGGTAPWPGPSWLTSSDRTQRDAEYLHVAISWQRVDVDVDVTMEGKGTRTQQCH